MTENDRSEEEKEQLDRFNRTALILTVIGVLTATTLIVAIVWAVLA